MILRNAFLRMLDDLETGYREGTFPDHEMQKRLVEIFGVNAGDSLFSSLYSARKHDRWDD